MVFPASQKPVTRISLVIWPSQPQNWLFWRTRPLTQKGEMLCWWANVCWDAAPQLYRDVMGAFLEVCEEKISCQSGTASIMALQCWKRKVLRLGKVSLPQWKGRGSTGLLHTVVCVHECAAQACIKLETFSCPSLCPQWLLPTLLSVFLTIISRMLFLIGGFRYSCTFFFWNFPFHHRMETAEAYKSLLSV